jgi:ubiquinone/menaquinone biosynthesis C-methylase UbiE
MKILIQLLMKLGMANYVASQLSQPNGFFGSRFIGRMMNKGNADLERFALECAEVSRTSHILEIGFGNGKLLQHLCLTTPDGRVYGVDIADDLINQVSKRLQKQIESMQLELHLAGVSKLPIADNSIDIIITNNTIYFWPEPLTDAKELLRVL